LKGKQGFDYDTVADGLRTLDRYTLQLRLAEPNPRFIYNFADASLFGAVAREVVEAYGDQIMAHPVGTGPFRLAAWTRSSRIVLERNPTYRAQRYEFIAADDAPDLSGRDTRAAGAHAAAARPRGDLHHRGVAAALAGVPAGAARSARPGARGLRNYRRSQWTPRALPAAARNQGAPDADVRRQPHLLQCR
jgi:hypothetical protein